MFFILHYLCSSFLMLFILKFPLTLCPSFSQFSLALICCFISSTYPHHPFICLFSITFIWLCLCLPLLYSTLTIILTPSHLYLSTHCLSVDREALRQANRQAGRWVIMMVLASIKSLQAAESISSVVKRHLIETKWQTEAVGSWLPHSFRSIALVGFSNLLLEWQCMCPGRLGYSKLFC